MTLSDIQKIVSRCDGTERLVVWMQDPSGGGGYKHYDVVLAGIQRRKGETRLYFEPSSIGQEPYEVDGSDESGNEVEAK